MFVHPDDEILEEFGLLNDLVLLNVVLRHFFASFAWDGVELDNQIVQELDVEVSDGQSIQALIDVGKELLNLVLNEMVGFEQLVDDGLLIMIRSFQLEDSLDRTMLKTLLDEPSEHVIVAVGYVQSADDQLEIFQQVFFRQGKTVERFLNHLGPLMRDQNLENAVNVRVQLRILSHCKREQLYAVLPELHICVHLEVAFNVNLKQSWPALASDVVHTFINAFLDVLHLALLPVEVKLKFLFGFQSQTLP